MRTHARTVLVVLLAALALGACGGSPSGDAVATVNGQDISSELFERLVRAQVNNPPPSSPLASATGEERVTQIANLQRQLLTQLVRSVILDAAATELGVEVTDEQVQERFEQEEAFRGDPEAFARRLAELGYTEADAREVLRSALLQEGFQEEFSAQIEVTDEELRAYYDERKPFEYEVADARHILVESRTEAEEILQLLEAGADFATLAEERSTDQASAVQGGSLGRAPRGSYVEAFDEALWNADEGELVGPIETEFGFHVLRVDEFVDISFEEAREDIDAVLRGRANQEQLNAFVQGLFAEAEVSIDSRIGIWDPNGGQVVADDALA